MSMENMLHKKLQNLKQGIVHHSPLSIITDNLIPRLLLIVILTLR